jgi:fatty acid desaturase
MSDPIKVPIRPSAITGALCIGAAALLSLGILPILLGALVQSGRLSQVGVGQAAMLETFFLAFGAAFGAFWMAQGAIRIKVASVALLLVAIDFATAHAGSTETVLVDRSIAGLFAGLLLGAATTIIMRGKNPGRLSGILLGLAMLPQVAAGYLLPVYVIPEFGAASGFYVLAVGVLVAMLGTVVLPTVLPPLAEESTASEPVGQPVIVLFTAIVLQSCGLGAAWTYLELLSHEQGFAPSVIGLAVAASIACQVAAAWLAAWLSPRLRKWPVLLTLIALQTIATALAIATASPALFITAVCVFGAMPPAMQPFQVSEMIVLDRARQAALLVAPMILFGNGLGPLIASAFATETDVRIAFCAGVAMTAASVVFYIFAGWRAAYPVQRKTPVRIDRATLSPMAPALAPAEEKRMARELSPKIAWPTLILAIILPLIIGAIVWLGFTNRLSLWICAAVLSLLSYSCYTLVHESVHDNLVPGFPKLRWLNSVVGWEGALGLGYNWPSLMRSHVVHHARTNTDEDPDIWVKGGFAELILKALVGGIVQTLPLFLLRHLSPLDYKLQAAHLRGAETTQADAVTVGALLLLVASIVTGHFLAWLCLLFIPTRVATVLLAVYFQWLPHHPFDQTERYRNTRISLWSGAGVLTLGQSYHLIHHLWPSVPFYNYGRFYRRMHPTLLVKESRIEGLMVGAYAKDRSVG